MIKSLSIALSATAALGVAAANPVSVDLSSWTNDGGSWTRAADNNSVVQNTNGNPTVFSNGVDSQGQQLSGTIEVQTTSDDDFIGFVLGYDAGDLSNASADYLLIDWKQGQQGFFGCDGDVGLSISRVSGTLTNGSGPWCHDENANVTEIVRATNLGSTGWADNTEYDFDLVFTTTRVQVFVDGILELDITGSFSNGGFGFYNYSQASVRYGALTEQTAPEVPLPGAAALFIPAMLGGAAWRRSKAQK
ncbi:MAG: PEP-CTERM sorting domain-containing protein [Pseudomonadota bacterium]